ncbi:MAG TPA: hypothetical protein PLP14_07265, partial [Chitinophagaceae bacterium]|nr:hypothetical protein [Chitinophagaceae bacterium]
MNYSSKCIVIVLSLQSMLCSWAHAQKEERIIPIDQLMNSRNMTLKEIDSAANIYFRRSGTGKGSGYKQFQRWRYESQFHVNGEGYLISRLQEEQYLTADNGLYESLMDDNCMTEPGERWVEKGPFTLQTNAGATSPGIGALTAIAINTSQPFTIYVGSPEGGIWKSTDWGAHWQPKISCPNSYMSIFSIAIDPHNSNRIYAGTGNNGAGFLTSDDGGEHWVHCTHSTVPGGFVRKIWINPQYSNVIYTASSYGLLKSVDSGKHWNTLLAINMDDFEFKPGDTNTIYACGYSGIYRSLNGGQNWDTLGVSNGIFGLGKNRLAVTPADPNKVYLLRSDTNHKMFSMLMVSNNSGSFFVPIIGPSYPLKFFSANDTDTTGQAFHNMELEVSATNADDILIGGVDLFRSLDGGFSFNRITRWFLPQATPTMPYVHGDFQGILFRNGFWYVINDGGIYVSVNQGLAWTDLSNGLRIREFYRIGSSSIDSLQFVAGAQDNGTTATLSYLANQLTDWRGGDGMECIISPLNMQKMYGCAFSGNLFRTDDGGLTNIGLAKIPDGNWVTPYVLRPGSDNTIIAGGDEVYKSDNSGGFFYPITFNLTNNRIVDLAVAPSNSNYIYACDDNKLYVSKSNGFLWDTIAHIAQIKDIAVSPSNPD